MEPRFHSEGHIEGILLLHTGQLWPFVSFAESYNSNIPRTDNGTEYHDSVVRMCCRSSVFVHAVEPTLDNGGGLGCHAHWNWSVAIIYHRRSVCPKRSNLLVWIWFHCSGSGINGLAGQCCGCWVVVCVDICIDHHCQQENSPFASRRLALHPFCFIRLERESMEYVV